MPSMNFVALESSGSGTGIPTGTGPAFVAIATDQGPPAGGPLYVKCTSLAAVVSAFGPRSATNSVGYDWLNEFFEDGGPAAVAWVTRVTDPSNLSSAATLTLNDFLASSKPTVLVTALTGGTEGNYIKITVTVGTGPTFTAGATTSSVNLTAVSSFAAIGAGTPVSGAGVPASDYIATVTPGSSAATLGAAFTGTTGTVTFTPGTITVTVTEYDSYGNLLTTEIHGPYFTSAQLIADTTSAFVSFTQSAGTGFTTNLPAALTATSLTGGLDASSLTDADHVAALANFPASLGSGPVALPGKTSATAWAGLASHGAAYNRWPILDMVDSTNSATVAANAVVAAASVGSNGSYGFAIQGSLILPGISGGSARTVPGSAAVAALRSQVAQGNNQALCPAGKNWPLRYPLGFTTFFGPQPAGSSTAGCFQQADVNTLEANAVPVNVFANLYGSLCLYGHYTLLGSSVELVYDQATASAERMNIQQLAQSIMIGYIFDPLILPTFQALGRDLTAMMLREYGAGALYDGGTGVAANAFYVDTGPNVNTPQTAQAGQLKAVIGCHITRFADVVNTTMTVIPVTVQLPTGAAS